MTQGFCSIGDLASNAVSKLSVQRQIAYVFDVTP